MDDQAKDVIATEVGKKLESGDTFKEALDKVLSSNRALEKSESWTEPSRKQRSALRDRITTDKRTKTFSISKKGTKDDVEYIQVDEGNYEKVLSSKDYKVTSKGNIQIRDSQGQWTSTTFSKD